MVQRDHFDHEKLDVYWLALELIPVLDEAVRELPAGRGHLAEQLRRASASIPLNIAEGAGEFSLKDKARFYRMARRSATECAAILDVCVALTLVDEKGLVPARSILLRIVAMLTRMAQREPRDRARALARARARD